MLIVARFPIAPSAERPHLLSAGELAYVSDAEGAHLVSAGLADVPDDGDAQDEVLGLEVAADDGATEPAPPPSGAYVAPEQAEPPAELEPDADPVEPLNATQPEQDGHGDDR